MATQQIGTITTDFGFDDYAQSVTLQTDGKLVVAGYSLNPNDGYENIILARYNANGSLDTTFDTDGITIPAVGSYSYAQSVTLQADEKILVAGVSNNGVDDDFALLRYNSNGSLDTTFDADGKVTTAVGIEMDRGFSVTVQTDGKILVAGATTTNASALDDWNFALIRYNSDGSLDTSFDTDGKVITSISASGDVADSVILQADGKIFVAGYGRDANQ